MTTDKKKQVFENLWPKTKKELEKAIKNAKTMLGKGETHLKHFSEKSAEQAHKLSLSLRREKLYYALGKSCAGCAKSKWPKNTKISALIKEIKAINKEVKKKKK